MTDRKSKRLASKGKPITSGREASKHLGFETFTARDLQAMKFPPLKYSVDGIVVEGITLLAGKPKLGKSWMALNLAMAVASGGLALGTIQCKKGPVLYAALEDNPRRLQRRMNQCYGDSNRWPKLFHFTTHLPPLDERGLEVLKEWVLDIKPSLVIIDTLARVRPKFAQDSGYDSDYNSLVPLQQLAGEQGFSILVVHHQRKMGGDDPFDTISGTTGLTGVVDAALVLQRDEKGTTLYGRGRDIEEFEKAVSMKQGHWEILGDPSEINRSEERKEILKILADANGPLGPKKIALSVEKPENNVKQLLAKMMRAGEVQKKERGKYSLPDT
jgi:predicted ATP-dependent serine protease